MPHYDVELTRVYHVAVPDDVPEPRELAIEQAFTHFLLDLDPDKQVLEQEGSHFFATNLDDVYNTCDGAGICQFCGKEENHETAVHQGS